jgi:hypothetical protein
MTARQKDKNPAELIAELDAQKMALAVQRAEAQREMQAAHDRLGVAERGPNESGQGTVRPLPEGEFTIPERRQAAEEAQALGRDHEPLDLIAADEAELGVKIRVNRPRLAALEGAMATLRGEVEAIEDQHVEWFARKAHGLSVAEVETRTVARAALMDAFQARQDARAAWARVNKARLRLGWNSLGEVPADDLASTISGFDASGRFKPWPKGRRLDGERELAVAWSPEQWQGTRLSNRDASARFGGEPLLETI